MYYVQKQYFNIIMYCIKRDTPYLVRCAKFHNAIKHGNTNHCLLLFNYIFHHNTTLKHVKLM